MDIFGLALVILGILDLIHFDSPLEDELLTISTAVATAAIVLGVFIIAVAFLGLFGALRANANVLLAYAIIILIMGFATLGFMLFAYVKRSRIYDFVEDTVSAAVKEGESKYGSSKKWTAIIDWLEATHCATAVADAVDAELITIGGSLLGITLLSFFTSALAFVLARDIKVYDKL
ncbi:unnamed protein product [Dibothriocephalus latus]|uniref:Tetraspanin n=1 Tax=Dibothriocephalus latus TaxID=60516 RepID=A0A3P7MDC2_DIBLA|nr:unnamed protein product [Dibothriocephalus latus]